MIVYDLEGLLFLFYFIVLDLPHEQKRITVQMINKWHKLICKLEDVVKPESLSPDDSWLLINTVKMQSDRLIYKATDKMIFEM